MGKKTPKLRKIRHKLFALLSGSLVFSQIMMGVTYYSGPGINTETPAVMSHNIITLTNTNRTSANVPVLTESSVLDKAADMKLNDMFVNNYWDHVAPSGMQAWDFMKQAGYDYEVAGENLAKGYHDSGSTVTAWMNSPSHKENLLSPKYTEIGVAVGSGTLDSKPVTLVVQLFGKPQVALAASPVTETKVLAASQSAGFDILSPITLSRLPYFIAWLVLFALIVFDGITLRKLGLHKSKKHMFEFRSALLINSLAFIILFINFAAVR